MYLNDIYILSLKECYVNSWHIICFVTSFADCQPLLYIEGTAAIMCYIYTINV